MLDIALLYFVVMIGVFIALVLWAKLPSGLCLMIASVVGAAISALLGALIPGVPATPFGLRYFVEGAFGYFDTILIVTTAMIFMGAMQVSGALEYISALLVKTLRKFPSLLLIAFIIIIMFPAMVTGSSLASAISAGALLAPIMIKWGIPKAKAGAIVALGAILGLVAPPVNVPAMVICDVVDIAYTGFNLPLLLLALPVAIISVLLIGRKYVKALSEEEARQVVNMDILDELSWTVCIPLVVLVLLIIAEMIWPIIFGSLAMPAMFVIATILQFCFGRRLPFYKKHEKAVEEESDEVELKSTKKEEVPQDSIVEVIRQGVYKAFPAMGLLMGVGMFMEAITLIGSRGYFVINAVMLSANSKVLGYVVMAIVLPLFGGISSFGSASVLGGPFVMAMYSVRDPIFLTCGLSLLAAIGEFSPPTAMSATFAANMVGEKKWSSVTLAGLPAICVLFVYSMVYTIWFSWIIKDQTGNPAISLGKNPALALFIIMMVIAIAFAVVYEIIVKKSAGKALGNAQQEEVE